MTADAAMRPAFAWRQGHTLALFSAALFLSAALMFMLQPMIGKMLLPIVGGTPSGWLVAMAFFQLMLLAGYAVANRLARLSARGHGLGFIVALLIGGLFLPMSLAGQAANSGEVFLLLTRNVAAPFIALAMTSSTLQRLFTSSGHRNAADPYFLYAASNLGSFGGLLLYPLAAETLLTVPQQTTLWVGGYIALLAVAGSCVFMTRHDSARPAPVAKTVANWRWALYAFIPSSLMMGVTSQITTAIVAAPLLWVLPLAIYLLTFVIAFNPRFSRLGVLAQKSHPAAVCLANGLIFLASVSLDAPWVIMALQLACFGTVALYFHTRLAALRPLDDAQGLTQFYLLIAAGGALGGILNAFIAPVIFNRPLEYPLVLLFSLFFSPALREKLNWKDLASVAVGGAGLVVWALLRRSELAPPGLLEVFLIALFVIAARNPRFALAGCALIALNALWTPATKTLDLYARNFYGLIRVYDREFQLEGETYHIRYFGHGTTVHGMQSLDPDMADIPTSYFSHGGPVGDIFHSFMPKNVAVLGLGAGTLACHHAPDRRFTFIEIDPAVVQLAQDKFTFLSSCPGAQPHRLMTGDGRLEMAKLKGEKFDLIILDAFSSDMVPVHLISTEAIALYKSMLAAGGLLVFNISNNYVQLANTLAAGAKAEGLQARFKDYRFIDPPLFLPSEWLVMAEATTDLSALDSAEWATPPAAARAWTDQYSNIISVMRFQ